MTQETINEIFRNFKPTTLDPNDPEIIKMIEQTLKDQEKLKELMRIDPELGGLFVGNL